MAKPPMVRVTIRRDLLVGSVVYAPGDVAAIPAERAAELVGCDHAAWVDEPTPELCALEAEARAAHLVREGMPATGAAPPRRVGAPPQRGAYRG